MAIFDSETCPCLENAMGAGGGNIPMILAIHETDGQDVTVQEEIAYSLVTGGG